MLIFVTLLMNLSFFPLFKTMRKYINPLQEAEEKLHNDDLVSRNYLVLLYENFSGVLALI